MDEDSAYAASLAFVPDRTRLEMTDMVYNKDEGQFFGKTEYNGKTGWVSLSKVLLLIDNSQVSIEEVISIEGPGDLWDEYDSGDHN